MTNNLIREIIKQVGTPVYIYEDSIIKKRYFQLKGALPEGAGIYYSIKANPSLAISQVIKECTDKVEVSSLGEIYCALKVGFKGQNILFSGPGKSQKELYMAIKKNIKINVESIQEIYLINGICSKLKKSANVLLRINPDFSLAPQGIVMTGVASQFGIDISHLQSALDAIVHCYYLNLLGISVYIGSQILNSESILKNTKQIIELYLYVKKKFRIRMKEIDFGGGFGVSYFNDQQIDLKIIQDGMNELFNQYKEELENTKISFESGRYLLAESGSYLMKILYNKHSKGKEYLICDGGFHHMLIAAYFSREIRGNFPLSLIRKEDSIKHNDLKEYNIAGPLCSPSDILGYRAWLPRVRQGDYIRVRKVGAYGLTFSPLLFISHTAPAEVLVKDNSFYLIRKRSRYQELFKNQLTIQSKGDKNVNE